MLSPSYCDYIAYEVKQTLSKCIEEAQLDHHFWKKPSSPLIQAVGDIKYSESPGMDLTKKITVSDVNDKQYLITIEEVKGN
jgi:hypothetical protein